MEATGSCSYPMSARNMLELHVSRHFLGKYPPAKGTSLEETDASVKPAATISTRAPTEKDLVGFDGVYLPRFGLPENSFAADLVIKSDGSASKDAFLFASQNDEGWMVQIILPGAGDGQEVATAAFRDRQEAQTAVNKLPFAVTLGELEAAGFDINIA